MNPISKDQAIEIAMNYSKRRGAGPFCCDGALLKEIEGAPVWEVFMSFTETPDNEIDQIPGFIVFVDAIDGSPKTHMSL